MSITKEPSVKMKNTAVWKKEDKGNESAAKEK